MAIVASNRQSTSSRGFGLGPRVRAAFATRPHERASGEPVWRPLRVLAVDPTLRRSDGAIATVRVPYEPLQPGPAGALFVVDPHDDAANVDYQPVDLDQPAVLIDDGVAASPGNPQFHQQMAYGVASAVYASFRAALGRDPAFAVPADATGRARLRLRPHAAPGLNAWYDRHRGEIAFGYAPGPDGFVFTCLSHDVVAHEVTHALVDGLRSRFAEPTNRDVAAFHEALSDLVALFHRFTYPEVVRAAMRTSRGDLREARALTDLARQVGEAYRWPALRQALDEDPDTPDVVRPDARVARAWRRAGRRRVRRVHDRLRPEDGPAREAGDVGNRRVAAWRSANRPAARDGRRGLGPGTPVSGDLHPRDRLLPAGRHRIRRVPARGDHRRPRPGAG